MRIYFKTKKLQRICSIGKEAKRQLGAKCSFKLQQRLMELKAADNLADISHLPPPRCHELTGNRAGQLSIDLQHPYRLIFIVADDILPQKDGGGLDWEKVKEIEIIDIADTH